MKLRRDRWAHPVGRDGVPLTQARLRSFGHLSEQQLEYMDQNRDGYFESVYRHIFLDSGVTMPRINGLITVDGTQEPSSMQGTTPWCKLLLKFTILRMSIKPASYQVVTNGVVYRNEMLGLWKPSRGRHPSQCPSLATFSGDNCPLPFTARCTSSPGTSPAHTRPA